MAQENKKKHLDSAAHMSGHKLQSHSVYFAGGSAGQSKMLEDIQRAVKGGQKIHVTSHPKANTFHVSTWGPKSKK